jgi:hypothetical protein
MVLSLSICIYLRQVLCVMADEVRPKQAGFLAVFDFLNCSRVSDFARSLVQSSAVNSAFYLSGIYFISFVRFF